MFVVWLSYTSGDLGSALMPLVYIMIQPVSLKKYFYSYATQKRAYPRALDHLFTELDRTLCSALRQNYDEFGCILRNFCINCVCNLIFSRRLRNINPN
jgi:hypothetical protein